MTSGKPGPGRTLLIYCDSQEEKISFDDLSLERGPSTSRVLLNVIREWKANLLLPRAPEESEDIQALRGRIRDLEVALRSERRRVEDLEAERRRLLAEPWLSQTPLTHGFVDLELIRALKTGPVQDHQLLVVMGVDRQDGRAIRALTRQLEWLEGLGLIKKGQRGWSWQK